MNRIIFILFVLVSSLVQAQDTITKTTSKVQTGVRPDAKLYSSFIDTIPAEVDVYIVDFKDNYWKINYFDIEGWVTTQSLWKTKAMYEIIKNEGNAEMIEKYGDDVGRKINSSQVWIGMSKEMLIDSRGYPEDKNITTGSWGKHEQWVYKDKYVYLEDGIVTATQSSY